MKRARGPLALATVLFMVAAGALAADAPTKKLTCCQEAAAKGKDCTHRCCISAHKEKASCIKCNPNKEDLALKKAPKKATTQASK